MKKIILFLTFLNTFNITIYPNIEEVSIEENTTLVENITQKLNTFGNVCIICEITSLGLFYIYTRNEEINLELKYEKLQETTTEEFKEYIINKTKIFLLEKNKIAKQILSEFITDPVFLNKLKNISKNNDGDPFKCIKNKIDNWDFQQAKTMFNEVVKFDKNYDDKNIQKEFYPGVEFFFEFHKIQENKIYNIPRKFNISSLCLLGLAITSYILSYTIEKTNILLQKTF